MRIVRDAAQPFAARSASAIATRTAAIARVERRTIAEEEDS
jgi:hypothetical protein